MKYILFYKTEKIDGAIIGKSTSEGWKELNDFDNLDALNNFITDAENKQKQLSPNTQYAHFHLGNIQYIGSIKYHWMVIYGKKLEREIEEIKIERIVTDTKKVLKDFKE